MANNRAVVIVPDVHGRTFWKECAGVADCDVVFLGDYLDPYPNEGITMDDAIRNFSEILEFARKSPNVRLLLGNHDLGYIIGENACDVRRDYARAPEIARMFETDKDMFSIAYGVTVADRRFLLTHAGVHPDWVECNSGLFEGRAFPEVLDADYLNSLYSGGMLGKALCDRSWYFRGGDDPVGSLVWADLLEFAKRDVSHCDVVQIVGHTMLVGDPLNLAERFGICCTDSKKCSYIDTDGNIRVFSTDAVVENYIGK